MVMPNSLAYAKYFRNSLADAELGRGLLNSVETKRLMERPLSEFESGNVGLDAVINLFAGENEDLDLVNVIVRPRVFLAKFERAKKIGEWTPGIVAPIVGFARIDREGRIYPSGKTFITRDVLEPLDAGSFAIGLVEAQDEFLSLEESPAFGPENEDDETLEEESAFVVPYWQRWKDYLSYCDRLFYCVAHQWPGDDDSHVESEHWFLQKDDSSGGISRSIINLYEHIQKTKPEAPLFDAYTTEHATPIVECMPANKCFSRRLAHSGDKHPLSVAQRDALTHLLASNNGEILAVNGPPGTGKTTLILSAVANLWANAAVDQDFPPVILAASSNNQAVTNIIDAFGKDFANGEGLLAGRWLPELRSFGAYFPSQVKSDEAAKKYQTDVFFSHIETRDFVVKALPEYLALAQKAFPDHEPCTLDSVVALLRQEILRESIKLAEIDAAWDEYESIQNKIEAEYGVNIEAVLSEQKTLAQAHKEVIAQRQGRVVQVKAELEAEQENHAKYMDLLEHREGDLRGVQAEKAREGAELARLTAEMEKAKRFLSQWNQFLADESIFFELFSFSKAVTRKRMTLAKKFLVDVAPFFPAQRNWPSLDAITQAINNGVDQMPAKVRRQNTAFANVSKRLPEYEVMVKDTGALLETQKTINTEVYANLVNQEEQLQAILDQLSEQVQLIDDIEKSIADLNSAHQDWNLAANVLGVSTPWGDHEMQGIDTADAQADTGIRFNLFLLTTHYWEGRWLQESARLIKDRSNFSRECVVHRWQCRMMLTPCIVGTFFMMPRLMQFSSRGGSTYQDNYLYNFADLLIVDEAGQVLPEVAGATFALAKKAMVVGDTLQIEPIWSISPSIDIGNLIHAGLVSKDSLDTDYKRLQATGKTAATGSVMHIAQQLSKFHYNQDLARGMFLFEHRRCFDEIIEFCNELCYGQKLIPKRGANQNTSGLPAMGFLHVDGVCAQRNSGSRHNLFEANTIAAWIAANRSDLEEKYALPIHAIIAVVTPFKVQANKISAALRAEGIEVGQSEVGMTVGTIHSLQGSERPVIIFSPTYTKHSDGNFIDAKLSMLNVSVSRARDSFLVFGDMDTFNQDKLGTPRGLLASYLFEKATNELCFESLPRLDLTKRKQEIIQLIGSAEHDEFMRIALGEAKVHVMIATPSIDMKAIEQSGVLTAMADAVKRGVEIGVFSDIGFNESRKSDTRVIQDRDALAAVGVKLYLVEKIHGKLLSCDSNIHCTGSFNWLGAYRDAEFVTHESTLAYRGQSVADEASLVRQHLDSRVLNDWN